MREKEIAGTLFRWRNDGALEVLNEYYSPSASYDPIAQQGIVDFIQAGPPKKKYKITRTFDDPPQRVTCNWLRQDRVHDWNVSLTDNDIEEVWE